MNVLFSQVLFEYLRTPHSLYGIGISSIEYGWKAEALVHSVSPVLFMCDDDDGIDKKGAS